MVKFCPECGIELENEFKFCPSCGFDLSGLKGETKKEDSNSPEIQNKVVEVKICENCGEENSGDSEICSGCGIKLGEAKIVKKSVEKEKIPQPQILQNESKPKNNKSKPKPVKKNNKNKTTSGTSNKSRQPDKKSLGTANVAAIFAGIIAVIFLVLYLTGTFDKPAVLSSQVSSNPAVNSGIDLSNLQQISDLEKEVAANPKDTTAILHLAHLNNDSGFYDKAIKYYRQYLVFAPKDPDARIDMGICYYNLRQYDTAINEMEQAIKYAPKHQIGYLDLGIVNLAAGNMEKSKEWLQKAVSLDPASEYGKKAAELLNSHKNN